MNLLDVVVLAAVVLGAAGGYRVGFVARAASWIGLGAGLVIGARLLPEVLDLVVPTSRAESFLVAAGVLLGAAFIGQLVGVLVGGKLRIAIPAGPARTIDHGVGGLTGALGVLVVFWLLLPAVAETPGWPARQARASTVAQAIDQRLPPAPDASQTLRALVGEQSPRVFTALREAPEVGPAPGGSGLPADLVDQVARSSVKITGPACRRIQEGSGFVVGDDLVVTNAHVVAGEEDTSVQRLDGSAVDAEVVAFDAERDLAVLSAPGLDRPALAVGESAVGTSGGVFGYPGGGPLRVAPFQVAEVALATGTDIYDLERTDREVLFLAAALAPGDSGAALVGPDGAVVGVAFAVAPDQPNVAYALSTAELEAVLATVSPEPVSTGSCV